MKGLCSKCEKRDTCQKLCSEAELWAGQDWVKQTETIIYTDNIDSYSEENKENKEDTFSFLDNSNYNKWLVYKFYYIDNLTVKEVSENVKYSSRWIKQLILNLRKNIRKYANAEGMQNKKWIILHSHFIKKCSIKEIVNIFNFNDKYVRTVINDYVTSILIKKVK